MEVNYSLSESRNVTALPMIDVFPIRSWILLCYCVISLTGIVGNTFVILVISRHETMGATSFRIYVGALAVADLLVTLFCIPIYITSTSNFHYHLTGMSGKIMCKLLSGYMLPFHLAGMSIYIMVAISIQRYFAICRPLSSMANPSPSKAKMVVFGIWVWSIILAVYPVMGLEYADEGQATVGAHCKFSAVFNNEILPKTMYVLTTSVQFIIPFVIMIFCFFQIKVNIIKQIKQIKLQDASSQSLEMKRVRLRKQTVTTVLIVIVSFIILLTPSQFLYFCFNFSLYQTSWNSNLYQSTVVLYFVTSCINPVIYAFRSKPFRNGLKETFEKCFGKLRDRSQSGMSLTISSVIHPGNGSPVSERSRANTGM